jgi:hypothetical protein
MVADVSFDEPPSTVIDVDAAGRNAIDPLISHSPSVRVIDVTLAAVALVRATALPEAMVDDIYPPIESK